MKKILFKKSLVEGIILSRPNRFIMIVQIGNKEVKTHCPTTGRIGNIVFRNIPCLLSKSENPKRKTAYTVEAISLDEKDKKDKIWIGINQTKVNGYIEYLLNRGLLKKISSGEKIEREVRMGKSRIDFRADGNLIEVKMPLISLPNNKTKNIEERAYPKFNSFDRLIKHFSELSNSIEKNKRAILLMCYMYNAAAFHPPKTDSSNMRIKTAAKKAVEKGVENWQVNLKIDKNGVSLIKYFKLNLFD
jgi:sugar fermentation stimulation protein A